MIEIRDARRSDADDIAAAHIEGWRVGYRDLLPDAFLDAPQFATERLARWRAWTWPDFAPGGQLFVGVLHERVVGFGHCGPQRLQAACDQSGSGRSVQFNTDCGEVYGFYLHPIAWGTGTATALMNRCTAHLRTQGFPSAVLWVLRDNPRARSFYEKAGWLPSGRELLFSVAPTAGAEPTDPLPEVEYARDLPTATEPV